MNKINRFGMFLLVVIIFLSGCGEKNEKKINLPNEEIIKKEEIKKPKKVIITNESYDISDIGKTACNVTNDVCKGTIIEIKNCKTVPSLKCYVVDMGKGYSRTSERPVSNIYTKER